MNFGVASGYADYSGELHIIKKLKKVNGKNVVFDIGANVGDWSKFLVNEYESTPYTLYMFEPSRKTFELLTENITANEKHFFHNIGFGDKKDTLEIFYEYETQGSASILMKGASHSETVEIETLDDFCDAHNISEIDILKMDVQGYEYNILQGAKRLLSEGKIANIQFEFDEPNIEQRLFFKDFWELLHDSYDIYHSLYNGLVKVNEYHYELENYRCMNYLAVKK
jgi:FkbM family methyltransferase